MFKYIKLAALALLFSVGFTACDDDDDYNYVDGNNTPAFSTSEAYVLIQGNMYGGVSGSIDKLLLSENGGASVQKDFFTLTNKQQLGDGPQEGLHYGSKIYVSVQGSNILWVLDAGTLEIEHKISMNQPTALCATKGYVFATNYDGNVTRIDTFHLDEPVKTMEVGPNPDGIAAFNNKVYVTISDGMNFNEAYGNGKKVVELNAEAFSKTKEYKVGVNPGQIVTNNIGEVFLVSRGNYADVTPVVQKITLQGEVIDYEPGSLIAVDRDMLYIVDSQTDWATGKCDVTVKRMNMTDDNMEDKFIAAEDLPAAPTNIAVHPVTRDLYVCSDKNANGFAESGWVYQYNYGGQLLNKFNVGIHPYDVIFK